MPPLFCARLPFVSIPNPMDVMNALYDARVLARSLALVSLPTFVLPPGPRLLCFESVTSLFCDERLPAVYSHACNIPSLPSL